MKEFAVRWRISKFFHAVGWIIVLFLLNVFQTVKCYCRDNDNTFKYELEVCVDTEDCKGVDQYGENISSISFLLTLSNTTGKGYAAYYTGCDRVHLPALAISRGAGAYHSCTFQPCAKAVKNTSQDKCAHGYPEYGNT